MQHRMRTDRDLCCGGMEDLILNLKEKKERKKEALRISLVFLERDLR